MKVVSKCIGKMLYTLAERQVNQACIWWTYQEKIPVNVNAKLKRK